MRRYLASALLAAVAFVPAVRAAEHLTNGGFETESHFDATAVAGYDGGFAAPTGTQMDGWTIVAGHAATVHNSTYAIISGTYSVNLDGEGYNQHNADFYQDFSTTLGTNYAVAFDHIGWNIGNTSVQATVTITDTITSTIVYSQLFGWTSGVVNEAGSFLGSGNSYRIEVFESPESHYNDNGLVVDNFSVTDVRGTTVPLPASALAGLPLLGTLAVARLRRAKRA